MIRRGRRAERPGRVSGRWPLWLLAAAAIGGLAAALPSLTLFTLAAGLVLTVLAGVLVTAVAGGRVSVTRTVPVREAGEDDPLLLDFSVRMPAWAPARLEVRTADGGWAALDRDGGTVDLVVGRRGAHVLGPSRLRVGDPLGILRRPLRAGSPEPVLVLPDPAGDARTMPPRAVRADDLEPDGLRPYVPGSPISRIHWASLARGGELQERRFAAPPSGLPLVIVDTADATDPRAVDWVARAAAGCVLALARDGGCEVLLPGAETPVPAVDEPSWRAVRRRLALLEGGQAAVRPPGGRASSVVQAPAGLDLGPPRPPLPPGVVALPAGRALHLITDLNTPSHARRPASDREPAR
ncbi:DUF58 domain-containing protein [Spirillospora sp. NPDC029432]|uniref:DUF58 domain-containing protein n=1 Tax=Spirillospora sp. NPDC029432 TaxID=3154599 RepID=UPI003454241A